MSLPKYIVNYDELTDPLKKELLKLIDDAIKDKYPEINTNNIEADLDTILDLLPSNHYEDLKRKIDAFVYKKIIGIQKAEGVWMDIPPLVKRTQHDFKYDKDVFLTGFHVDQNGWKKEDRYHLIVNKKYLIKNAATKEIGEHKYFNTFYKVNANTPISFILENNSGNSRETMIDLEYIEGEEVTITPPLPPDPPPSADDEYWMHQIKNKWNLAVVMNWDIHGETINTSVDVDLHGFIKDNHIYFGNKSAGGAYLNFDYVEHFTNTNPEILSVGGNQGKTLKVYIHNYNSGILQGPVSIKIYKKDINGNPQLIKEYKITLESDSHYLIGVCSIVMGTYAVSDLSDRIRVF